MSRMSEGEMILDVLSGQVQVLELVPLDDLLVEIRRHQATAPILDPTGFMRGGSANLSDQERLVEAAIAYRNAARRIAGAR